jgi:hypothetical protein
MKFNDHKNLAGSHAFLSASNYHWLNDDKEAITRRYLNFIAIARGTELHEYAATAIRLKRRQPKTNETVNKYINDAIGFDMEPEVVLFYSVNAFGTADSISFKNDKLRIHDLKTGVSKTSFNQLYIYDALFCLEYGIKPGEIEIENRIYQSDEVRIEKPDATIIAPIISKIITNDKIITKLKEDGGV